MTTRNRILSLPGSLEKGDVVRDFGTERTVTRTETSPSILAELVIVHFEPIPDRPDLPPSLAVPASQRVTTWRTQMGEKDKNDEVPKDRPPEMDTFKQGLAELKAGNYEAANELLNEAREIQRQDGRD